MFNTRYIYPDPLKIAAIKPIHKSGNKKDIKNYRPISILPLINKLFEKLIVSRIDSFIERNNILCDSQFGFRRGKDTEQATLKLLDCVTKVLQEGSLGAIMFLDFSRAFDTVDHATLLYKLDRYGIRGVALDLISSYLSNRKQCVYLNGAYSNKLDVSIGVPQGGCLSPLLFLLYTNDINFLDRNLKLTLFADDSTYTCSNACLVALADEINNYLNLILDWSHSNKLCLNIQKTKCLTFGHNRNLIPRIQLGGIPVETVDNYKYLGINLDNKFNYHFHLNVLKSKLASLNLLAVRSKDFLTLKSGLTFYNSLVQSAVCYGISVWGAPLIDDCPIARKVKRLQNRLIFNLFGHPHENLHAVDTIYKRVKILHIDDVYRVRMSLLVYKILHFNYIPHLRDSFLNQLRQHEHETRYRDHFLLPFPRVAAIKSNFLYQASKLWNSLPHELKNAPTLN